MAHLYAIKILGLILLLVIALALPWVLPQTEQAASGQLNPPAPVSRSIV